MTIITAADLADRIGQPDLVICDVRHDLTDHDRARREYRAAHLPGAVFVDLHTELSHGADPGTVGGRHRLPSPAEFTDLLGSIGVTPNSLVVAYDGGPGGMAARLWWMLTSIGHTRAAVLDGGYAAWIAGRYDTTAQVDPVTATDYPSVSAWSGTIDAVGVAEAIDRGDILVDARHPQRYRGDDEPLDLVAGHIPGAINRFHGKVVNAAGHYRPVADLKRWAEGVGDTPIVYCGSGVTACQALLAMTLAGVSGARLYPGSWSDWYSDPTRPISTGG